MRVLVTGGAGFIGSSVIRHVISATDDDVVNVDICDRVALEQVFNRHRDDAVVVSLKQGLEPV